MHAWGRGGGSLRQRAVPAPDATALPPPVQLLEAARSPTRPPPPSPATEPPQPLRKARGEKVLALGAKGGGSETHLKGLREPSSWQRVLGHGAGRRLSAEPRRGAWPGAGAGGRRGTPRRALQGAARPARLSSARSARPPASARWLASARSAPARRGARFAVLSASGSAGIHPPAGRRREERRGGGERVRVRAYECLRGCLRAGVRAGPPDLGAGPRAPLLPHPPPGRFRRRCLLRVPEPFPFLRGPMARV